MSIILHYRTLRYNKIYPLFVFQSVWLSFAQISSGEAYLVYSKKIHSNSDFNQYVAALYKVVGTFMFGAAVSQSLTDLAKFTIGRPRPNFMEVCKPTVCKGYMLQINCTGPPRAVNESRYWGPNEERVKSESLFARLAFNAASVCGERCLQRTVTVERFQMNIPFSLPPISFYFKCIWLRSNNGS